MSTPTMADRVDEYLTYRGHWATSSGSRGRLLQSFARYADESGHGGL